jgi:hypothetical protein
MSPGRVAVIKLFPLFACWVIDLIIIVTTNQVPPRFGLLDESPDRWANIRKELAKMNAGSGSEKTSYKLLMFGRHGQGYRSLDLFDILSFDINAPEIADNLGLEKYGLEAWNAYVQRMS